MSKRKKPKGRDALGQLEATKRQADEHQLPDELKPCVAVMLEEGVPKGRGGIDTNRACHVIGCELRRLGTSHDAAAKICHEWQGNTGEVLSYGEVEKTVRSAYRGEHQYGCGKDSHLYNSGYCMGQEACPYYKRLGGRREAKDLDFFEYGWPLHLTSAATKLYEAVMALESKRQAQGGTTFASYRLLEKWSGVRYQHVAKALDELQARGLITYTPGQPGGHHKKAAEIRRVLPIPEVHPLV